MATGRTSPRPGTSREEVMTIDEVAELLRVHPTTLYRMVKKNEVPGAFKMGSNWRFFRPRVLDWISGAIDKVRVS